MNATASQPIYKLHAGKFGPILESVKVRYEKTDKRREKRYEAEVGYHFQSFALIRHDEVMWGDFEAHIKKVFEPLISTGLAVRVFSQGSWSSDMDYVPEEVRAKRCASIAVNFTMKAAKPKFIVDQEFAEDGLAKRLGLTNKESIREKILAGIEAALQAREGENAQKIRREHADMIARQLAGRATKAAKAITNFDVRLKALHEEVEAERRKQLAVICEKTITTPEEWKFTDGTMLDKRSVEAGVKNAEKAFKSLTDAFFDENRDIVKLDEV